MVPGINSKAKPRKKGRKCRRRLGARQYKNYTKEMLELVVELVQNKQLSSRQAARQFSIPKLTIMNKVHKLHDKPVGCATRLSPQEESKIVKVLISAAEFGCPFTKLDLRLEVFQYLNKNGRQDLFNGQPPGKAWIDNFQLRHASDLTVRSTQNIKTGWAEKSVEEFMAYFQNLSETLKDIPASNILNFDGSNLSDDPGSSKCIFRRGVKYPERVMNSSKGAISLMFSGTADGVILPVYVVYKAENLYTEWIQGGPRDARYNHTKSGWFDLQTFEDYFKKIVLVWASSLPGKKVVICDNLSNHLSVDVIELCENNDIKFVFIPANSTHLTQPMDVAFFGPLKKVWRKVLLQYKIENPHQTSLNKNHFPNLLKSLIEQIQLKDSNNIKSGFKAAGICPLNARAVLKWIPEYYEDLASYEIDRALLDYLKLTRQLKPLKVTRNKKVVTEPGKSVTLSDLQQINAPRSRVIGDGVKNSKNRINAKNKQKTAPLVDNIQHNISAVDMLLNEQSELIETTEKSLTNDIGIELTKLSNIMCEDDITETNIMFLNEQTGLIETTGNRDLTNEIEMDLIQFSNSMCEDDDTDMFLNERTGLIETIGNIDLTNDKLSDNISENNAAEMNKSLNDELGLLQSTENLNLKNDTKLDSRLIKIPGNRNNETKIKLFSTVSLQSISTGIRYQSASYFRPHVPYYDSDEVEDEDKENMQEEILFQRNHEKKKENSPLLSRENYSKCEETKIMMTIEDKILKQEMEPAKSNKKTKKECRQLLVRNKKSDSETDISENISYKESSDSGGYLSEDFEDEIEINENRSNENNKPKIEENENLLEHVAQNDIQVDAFVLVKFDTKKNVKHYVGKVIKVDGILVSVNFMRKKRNNTFSWPQVQDESEMYSSDIVKVLPKPIDMRRGLLKFDVNFNRFNLV